MTDNAATVDVEISGYGHICQLLQKGAGCLRMFVFRK